MKTMLITAMALMGLLLGGWGGVRVQKRTRRS